MREVRVWFRTRAYAGVLPSSRKESEILLADLRARFETLAAREREVMGLVVSGRLNKQIAGDIGVSEMTVKVYRGQAMRKMGAGLLPELARMTDRLKLTSEGQRRV